MERKEFEKGIKLALPVCLGILPVAISFGLVAVQAGLTRLQSILMSAFVMAGSAQFAAVGMWANAGFFPIVLVTFFINLRYLVMSGSLFSRFGKTTAAEKFLSAFPLSDESFAITSLSDSCCPSLLIGANTIIYAVWVLGAVLGAFLGDILPSVISDGFGVAFYAVFLAMLVPAMKNSRGILGVVALTALLNILLGLILPATWSIIISMVAAAFIGTFFVEEA